MIDILMATYNGEKYLTEQLDSLLAQTYSDWQLFIRDDCSKDRTWDILCTYQKKYPERIKIARAETPSGGAMQNFFKLLDYVEHEYVMFCDQDDVWLPDKIAVTVTKMCEVEEEYGKDKAILVHTDLCVVDEELNIISPSFFDMGEINPQRNKLNDLLVTNTVSGCTMLFNRALLELIKIPSDGALMHDSWIAMIATIFGKIFVLNKATLKYRQHGDNSCGVKPVNTLHYYFEKLSDIQKVHKGLIAQYQNAGEFKRIYGDKLSGEEKEMLECYSKFDSLNMFQRFCNLKKYHLFKSGFIRKIGQLLV